MPLLRGRRSFFPACRFLPAWWWRCAPAPRDPRALRRIPSAPKQQRAASQFFRRGPPGLALPLRRATPARHAEENQRVHRGRRRACGWDGAGRLRQIRGSRGWAAANKNRAWWRGGFRRPCSLDLKPPIFLRTLARFWLALREEPHEPPAIEIISGRGRLSPVWNRQATPAWR